MKAGDALPTLGLPPVTAETLTGFAEASGDDNPIHLDPVVAREMGYEGVIAHGMLSMAYVARLLTNWVPQRDIRSLRTKFVGMTPLGATPTCTGRVRAVELVNGELQARITLAVKLADGTTTTRGEAVVALNQ